MSALRQVTACRCGNPSWLYSVWIHPERGLSGPAVGSIDMSTQHIRDRSVGRGDIRFLDYRPVRSTDRFENNERYVVGDLLLVVVEKPD